MNNLIIKNKDSIKTALQKLQENKKRFLICLDDKLVSGLITDGDIRRGLLDGLTIFDSILTSPAAPPQ